MNTSRLQQLFAHYIDKFEYINNERSFVIEAEVFGKGIVMWLLSQGERVEVLGPEHIRTEMHDTISHMLELYR